MRAGVSLYDYQEEMVGRIDDAFRRHRSVMVQMPTGTGKTVVLAAYIVRHVGGRVLIVAHRRELVEQIERTVNRFFSSDVAAAAARSRIAVHSVQWLAHHYADVAEVPELVVVDEAHHAPARTYKEMWRRFPAARFLGLTATPCRMSRRALTDLFDVLLTADSVADFIRRGRLARFDFVTVSPDSNRLRVIKEFEKRGADGDFQTREMETALNNPSAVEWLCRCVQTYAPGRRGIVYAVSVAHARAIAAHYAAQGLRAAAISGMTPADLRRRLTADFREGRLDVLVNVDIFSEGFDCPETEFIQLARPTLSLSRYLQMVGRGLRTAHGKRPCVIIDNAGLCHSFGLPTRPRDWQAMFRGQHFSDSFSEFLPPVGGSAERSDGDDVEMTLVVTGDTLLETARRETEVLENLQKTLPLQVFTGDGGRRWGVRRGNAVVLEAVFRKIVKISDGFILATSDGNVQKIFSEEGREVAAFDAGERATLGSDGVAHVKGRDAYYLDLRTLRRISRFEASRAPKVVRYGRIEFLKTDHNYILREGCGRTFANLSTALTFEWRGTLLLVCELMSTAETDMLLPPHVRRLSAYMFRWCIFEETPLELYLVYAELPAGRLVVFREGIYYLVSADGSRRRVADNALDNCAEHLERLVQRERARSRSTLAAQRPERVALRSV